MELSESEFNKVLNRIKSQCELTEVKGTEEFYKLKRGETYEGLCKM